jgi:hypothetical protein
MVESRKPIKPNLAGPLFYAPPPGRGGKKTAYTIFRIRRVPLVFSIDNMFI